MSFLDNIYISGTLKWHNIILYLLIGVTIVILLFCFGPWQSSSTKKLSTSENKITWLDSTDPLANQNTKINHQGRKQKEGFTTMEQSVLLKALGFSELGDSDAKYNVLNVKTRSVMNPDDDIQVLDIFTNDVSLLQKLNSGAPVSLITQGGSSGSPPTPETTRAVTEIPTETIINAFQKSVSQLLYNNAEINKFLPADYLEFMNTLLNKLYLLNTSTASKKSWSAQDIINVKAGLLTELTSLANMGAASGWRKVLYDNRQAIVSSISSSIGNTTGISFPSDSNTSSAYSTYSDSIGWKIGLDTEISSKFAAQLYTTTGSGATLTVTKSQLTSIVASGTSKDDYIKLRSFQYYLNGLLTIASGNISTASASPNTPPKNLVDTISAQQTYVTTNLAKWTQSPDLEPITKLKGTTAAPPTAFVESLFIGVKAVIFNVISDSLIPTGDTVTTNPPGQPEYTKSEIMALQAIGSKNYNPATGERNSRATDFYLDFTNGLDIQVKFMYNYRSNIDNEVACDAFIKEVPNSDKPSVADAAKFKTYTFDKCLVDIDATGRKMLLKLNKVTDNLNYAKLVDDSVSPASVYNQVTVYQEFVIEVNFAKSISELVGNSSSESFNLLINAATLANSFVTYKLSTKLKPEQATPYTVYQLLIFPRAIAADFGSLNEFTRTQIHKTTETLLNDNVAEIITPMYMVDKQLDKAENVISKIKDYYKFNQLSNTQTRYQFYPVAQ